MQDLETKIVTQEKVIKRLAVHAEKIKLPLIDVILDYCYKNNVDPEVIGLQVKQSTTIKKKIAREAQQINMLK